MGVSLEENKVGDFLETADGFIFIAVAELKEIIKSRGGVSIDYGRSSLGSSFTVKFATDKFGC